MADVNRKKVIKNVAENDKKSMGRRPRFIPVAATLVNPVENEFSDQKQLAHTTPTSGKKKPPLPNLVSAPRAQDFGLSIGAADLNDYKKQEQECHVQFLMPDMATTALPLDQETSYDLNQDPLPDAVFITDQFPIDPYYHGYHNDNSATLEDAFQTLSEQIENALASDLESNSHLSDIPSSASQLVQGQVKSILKKRPFSANNTATNYKPKSKTRARSATAAKDSRYSNSLQLYVDNDVSTSDVTSDTGFQMEPVVFSCTTGKQIGGFDIEESDLNSKEGKGPLHNFSKAEDKQDILAVHSCNGIQNGGIPSCILHLLKWQTNDVPQQITGCNTADSLVLLPSFQDYTRNGDVILNVVPPPQKADAELQFIEKIAAPKPLIKTKRPLPEVKCQHGKKDDRSRIIVTPRIKIYSNQGQILHETNGGSRGAQVVRKEIQELEDLMQGIGSHEGCLVVQLQADINDINDTLDNMRPRLDEISRREAEKTENANMENSNDMFNMKAFYRKHDDVITQIRRQHRLCVLELGDIETELGIETDRAHFKTHPYNIRTKITR